MTWTDDLRRVTFPDGRKLIGASFRSVPFFVRESDRSGGRRAVVHEFPGADDPYVEDMGRKARSFRVDGYVIGESYIRDRDALLDALENSDGPGQLVHPYHGLLTVICTTFAVREAIADGRMAAFSIEFAEAPAQGIAPTAEPDLPGLVTTAAAAAVIAAQAEIEDGFDTSNLPSYATASAVTAIRAASAKVGETLKPVIEDTQELAATNGQLHLLTANAASLIGEPAGILQAFRDTFVNLTNTGESAPGALKDALLAAYTPDWGPDVAETTTTRVRERANQAALQAALRQCLVIEAARLAPSVPYASIEEATASRDAITDRLDELAAAAGDVVYPALVALRAAVVRALPGDAVRARVITVTRRAAVPSLLLAYQLYGSTDLEDDVIARNDISNPAFCVGDLQVLSDE